MIIDKIKEFYNKIFNKNNHKLLSEKNENVEVINEEETNSLENEKNFIEKIDVKELREKKREEIDHEYNIDKKDDFFKIYNMVKENQLSLDSLSLDWVIKVDLMLQEELAMMDSNSEAV